MAMPKEDGDGVGPKGEGALRAPLGEPEAWMFPAHIRTTHTHQRAHQTKDDKYSLHTLTPCAHKLKLGGRAVVSGWRAEMEGNGRSMTKRMLCSLLAARCACCKRNNWSHGFTKLKMGTHGCAIAFFCHNLLLQQMHKSAGWLMTQCVVRKQCCMAA